MTYFFPRSAARPQVLLAVIALMTPACATIPGPSGRKHGSSGSSPARYGLQGGAESAGTRLDLRPAPGSLGAGQIFIPCDFDGDARTCFVDSGANFSAISDDAFARRYKKSGKVESAGAAGVGMEEDEVVVKNLTVAKKTIMNVAVGRRVASLAKEGGVIGADILMTSLTVWRFDRESLETALTDAPKPVWRPLGAVNGKIPVMTLLVDGLKIQGAWDTGAGLSVVDEEIIKKHPSRFTFVSDVPPGRDATGSAIEMKLYRTGTIDLGGVILRDVLVVGMSFSGMRTQLDPRVKAIWGYNFITEANWVLDPQNRRWAAFEKER